MIAVGVIMDRGTIEKEGGGLGVCFEGKKGISVMTAVIILIGFSMLLASSLITLIPKAKPPRSISPSLSIHYEENLLTLTHEGGGNIPKAFVLENSEIAWKDLQIRKNGAKILVEPEDNAKLNRKTDIGLVTYSLGDQVKFEVELNSGDTITVIYLPTEQVLLSATV